MEWTPEQTLALGVSRYRELWAAHQAAGFLEKPDFMDFKGWVAMEKAERE